MIISELLVLAFMLAWIIGEGTGLIFRPENVGPLELATTSFGQGISVTPLQQVMAAAAIANGGYLMEP